MNYDEFAFVNQQLAGMLKAGIPLEGALRELSRNMQHGHLRDELLKLQSDLVRGIPLETALSLRSLPEFYKRMVQVGVKSNDLPAMLTMLADYYQRGNAVWTRLKGLMVYPLIVLVAGLCLSLLLYRFQASLVSTMDLIPLIGNPAGLRVSFWFVPLLLSSTLLVGAALLSIPSVRARMRWRLPAFREANLSQLAAAGELMLRRGVPLGDALLLLGSLESGSAVGSELDRWQARLAEGNSRIETMALERKVIPPLFVWILANAGENLAEGFRQASEVYHHRAIYRIEMMLYAALPLSVLALGLLVMSEVFTLFGVMARVMDALGGS